jgi:hypothetical protein
MTKKLEKVASGVASRDELERLLDRVLKLVDHDPEAGPQLAAAEVAQRFEFPDVGLVLNLISATGEKHNLRWKFSDDIDWHPQLSMAMTSEVANRYLQGKENFGIAIARQRIRVSCGDARAALRLLSNYTPIFAHYREVVARDFPKLAL